MFNLLISSAQDSWENGTFEIEKSRVAIEYTADEVSERYKALDTEALAELRGFPCIFAIENELLPSRIGYISEIRLRTQTVVIQFEFDPIFPPLQTGTIEKLRTEIDLGRWELSRTHWAIKDEPLMEILVRQGFISQEQVEDSHNKRFPVPSVQHTSQTETSNSRQVFIVHGHDEFAKQETEQLIRSLGLEPIILHQQASAGMTIIEKIESYSNVGFGIVLYTPCDFGAKCGMMTLSYRARQNVVFKHGYLIAKLGRDRVAALVKGQIETPNDISGIVYVAIDGTEKWKVDVKAELANAGYDV